MDELRDLAFALSIERRASESQRDGQQGASGDALERGIKSRAVPILFALGERVLVQDTFERPCGAQTPFWWEAVVSGCTDEEDYVRARVGRECARAHSPLQAGRPVFELTFADLEIQFSDSDGELAVQSETGGRHRAVFVNDCALLDVESGEELLYKPMHGRRALSELCQMQVVQLP